MSWKSKFEMFQWVWAAGSETASEFCNLLCLSSESLRLLVKYLTMVAHDQHHHHKLCSTITITITMTITTTILLFHYLTMVTPDWSESSNGKTATKQGGLFGAFHLYFLIKQKVTCARYCLPTRHSVLLPRTSIPNKGGPALTNLIKLVWFYLKSYCKHPN